MSENKEQKEHKNYPKTKIYITLEPISLKFGAVLKKSDTFQKIINFVQNQTKKLGIKFEVGRITENKTNAIILPEYQIGDFLANDEEVTVYSVEYGVNSNLSNESSEKNFFYRKDISDLYRSKNFLIKKRKMENKGNNQNQNQQKNNHNNQNNKNNSNNLNKNQGQNNNKSPSKKQENKTQNNEKIKKSEVKEGKKSEKKEIKKSEKKEEKKSEKKDKKDKKIKSDNSENSQDSKSDDENKNEKFLKDDESESKSS